MGCQFSFDLAPLLRRQVNLAKALPRTDPEQAARCNGHARARSIGLDVADIYLVRLAIDADAAPKHGADVQDRRLTPMPTCKRSVLFPVNEHRRRDSGRHHVTASSPRGRATELTLAPAQRANSASGVTRQLARSIGPRGCAFAALVVAVAVAVAADVGPLPSIWRPDPAPAAVVVAAVIAGVDERPAERKPTEAAMMEEAAPVMEPEP